jgi:hypothetical protein
MKMTVFWEVTPCRLILKDVLFGGTCSLHLRKK